RAGAQLDQEIREYGGGDLGVRVQRGRGLREEAGPSDLADHLLGDAGEIRVALRLLRGDRLEAGEQRVGARDVGLLDRELDEALEGHRGLQKAGRLLLRFENG